MSKNLLILNNVSFDRVPPNYYRAPISHVYHAGPPPPYSSPPGPGPTPAPDYMTSVVQGPGPELRRTTSTKDQRKMSFSLRRSNKYYPATFSHAPLELRPVKVKSVTIYYIISNQFYVWIS